MTGGFGTGPRESGYGVAVPEYTITTVSGDDWRTVAGRRTGLASALAPRSPGWGLLPGRGDHAFGCGSTVVTLSWELAGTWYAEVEGDLALEEADGLVAEVAHRLGEATGQPARVHRISDE